MLHHLDVSSHFPIVDLQELNLRPQHPNLFLNLPKVRINMNDIPHGLQYLLIHLPQEPLVLNLAEDFTTLITSNLLHIQGELILNLWVYFVGKLFIQLS